MDNTQNIISLCTGYGGLELGLHLAGLDMRTVAYVEIEAFAIANLVSKMEEGKLDSAPVWTDIKTFDGEPFRGKVHGIIGGYPCQPFSNAGQRKGTDDPRHLWPYIEQHIRTIRPVWCFFENVSGHLTLGFKEVFRSLRDMGYAVEAGLFTAAECKAPHIRARLFILAYSINSTGRQDAGGDAETNRLPSQRREAVCRGKSQGTSQQLGNTESQRIQRDRAEGQQEPETHAEQGLSLRSSGGGRWPAYRGQPQHDWEEPRTVKSGMGRTVDGFRSRVDELRLLGNGVVPQTAELAFRTLQEQHNG